MVTSPLALRTPVPIGRGGSAGAATSLCFRGRPRRRAPVVGVVAGRAVESVTGPTVRARFAGDAAGLGVGLATTTGLRDGLVVAGRPAWPAPLRRGGVRGGALAAGDGRRRNRGRLLPLPASLDADGSRGIDIVGRPTSLSWSMVRRCCLCRLG